MYLLLGDSDCGRSVSQKHNCGIAEEVGRPHLSHGAQGTRLQWYQDSIRRLQQLKINGCQGLVQWCESEEDTMKLAHINEIVRVLPIYPP